jgi:predicted RNase H-like nuclease
MFVAGVDGCRAGWIAFKVDVPSLDTSVDVVDLPKLLSRRPVDLFCAAIDIPIGLLDYSRACDKAARKLLGQPRGTSVFAAPCRAAVSATTHASASQINREKTGRGLSQQAFGIVPKIKQVDDAIRAEFQRWVLEVHPEFAFGRSTNTNRCCTIRRPKMVLQKGSGRYVRCFQRLNVTSRIDHLVSEQMICWMPQQPLGLP